MSLKTQKGIYLLRGDLKHKEHYQLTDDVAIYIAKEFENNLRERNPQVAYVEGIPEDNPLNLMYGDKVFVNHMVFFGEIGKDSPEYILQPHVTHKFEKLFPCLIKDIYFKICEEMVGSDQLEPIDGILLMNPITDEEVTASGIFVGEKERKDVATVINGKGRYVQSETLLVETNALYPFIYEKVKYFRLRESEVMGVVFGGILLPANDRILVENLDSEAKESLIDLSMVKGVEDIKSLVIAVGDNILDYKDGDTVLRRKSRGVKHGKYFVITVQGILDDESVWGVLIEKKCRKKKKQLEKILAN